MAKWRPLPALWLWGRQLLDIGVEEEVRYVKDLDGNLQAQHR